MSLDWNWFFSSVAQSAAAMVGVIAAFLVAKVLSNQAAFQQKRDQLPKLLAECDRIADRLTHCRFKYIEDTHFMDWDEDVVADFAEHGMSDPEEVYDRLEMEKARDDWLPKSVVLARIKDKLDALQAEAEEKERQRELDRQRRLAEQQALQARSLHRVAEWLSETRGLGENFAATTVLAPPSLRLETHYRWAHIPGFRNEISDATLAARHGTRTAGAYLASVAGNPERSGLVSFTLALLAFLFFCGVVYPLSFLPAPTNGAIELSLSAFWEILFSLKGLVLSILSVGVILLLAVFGFINHSLVHGSKDLDRLREFTKMGGYSRRLSYLDDQEGNLGAEPSANTEDVSKGS